MVKEDGDRGKEKIKKRNKRGIEEKGGREKAKEREGKK